MEEKVVTKENCLCCKFLECYFKKKRNSPNNKHYHCINLLSFDAPPDYCKYYERKEGKEQI